MNTLTKFTAIFLILASEVASADESKFDIIANLDKGPGNVTVMDNGRIIMSMHQFYLPNYSAAE